ncbi:adenosylcobinamide-phosphate synthase CbiB [Coralliovum pocilloporae]|uniref:adenosylcobinamide-phosphate synthase CbiB n=1 Tax=Coralliovum pocilloporae TaxID=3066369 RepID=UPI003306D05B
MLLDPTILWMVLGAIALDAWLGEPPWLWSRLSHPVVIIGNLIDRLDKRFNTARFSQTRRKLNGILTLLTLITISLVIGGGLHALFDDGLIGIILGSMAGATLIAQRSLYDHVKAVADGLDRGLSEGRHAVSMIVGRNPDKLDKAGVSRAAIESCAENFSDGVTAPLFWFALLGLPGLILYKAVNTADSMIGHRSDRYRKFGWASARFDDLLNYVPSRLTGLLFTLLAPLHGKSPLTVLSVMLRDAPRHKSPSAGWPESSMAALLGLALAGPRQYGSELVDDPYMNDGGKRDATALDIRRSLKILVQTACLITGLVGSLLLLTA